MSRLKTTLAAAVACTISAAALVATQAFAAADPDIQSPLAEPEGILLNEIIYEEV